jgi:indole-3-glycerol phosphate synthase
VSDVLARICEVKREHVAARKRERSLVDLQRSLPTEPPRGFVRALRQAVTADHFGLIAEIKKASPSRGLIRADFDPPALARAYAEGGATCLSVLTDEPFFQGSDAYLAAAREAVPLPALRKDFILDPYQVVEARAIGADCILLIMAALGDGEAAEIESAANELGMDVLVEVHDRPELNRALRLRAELIGVNNRNLKTLRVDLATTEELAPLVPPERLLVAESGLGTHDDLLRMRRAGASCFLVGERLMQEQDVANATRRLLGLDRAA